MGIIKRGILGGVSNKIGNVVGSSWKVSQHCVHCLYPWQIHAHLHKEITEVRSQSCQNWVQKYWQPFVSHFGTVTPSK